MIETAETRWGIGIHRLHDSGQLPVIPPPHLWVTVAIDYEINRAVNVPVPTGMAADPTVVVYAFRGVWRAVCPLCGGAQHASRDEWFYCFYCRNEQAAGKLLPQVWPVNADVIERVLMFRPLPEYRSWAPGETITDLRRQDVKAIRQGLHTEGVTR